MEGVEGVVCFDIFLFFYYFCFYREMGKGGACRGKEQEGENSKMRVDLNKRSSYFFLFELQDFHCEIRIRIRGERRGVKIWKSKV